MLRSSTTLVQVTHHPLARDFRKPLLEAAARAEGVAFHVQCGERRMVTTLAPDGVRSTAWGSADEVALLVRSVAPSGRRIVLTGVQGAWAPDVMRVVRRFPRRDRAYDVQDDLSYGATGLDYVKFLARDAFWRSLCPCRIVLELGMQSRYPRAKYLDNASDVVCAAVGARASSPLVYIGSIDERLDLELIERLTNVYPLDVWGVFHESARDSRPQLERLAADGRVILRGPYANDDLTALLGRYVVGVIPYRAEHRLTRHINPDKLYHYLNAGLGVISSAFPQALRLEPHVAILTAGGSVETARDEALRKRSASGWVPDQHRWAGRWEQLVSATNAGSG